MNKKNSMSQKANSIKQTIKEQATELNELSDEDLQQVVGGCCCCCKPPQQLA
jgi:bacteriocin-like protein